jgi:hypothetical protein
LLKRVNSFIGSIAGASMNDSITASWATAARDTQSRSERCRLIDASPYRGSGASATTSHCFCERPAAWRGDRSLAVGVDAAESSPFTSSRRTGPVPGRPAGARSSDGARRAAIRQ